MNCDFRTRSIFFRLLTVLTNPGFFKKIIQILWSFSATYAVFFYEIGFFLITMENNTLDQRCSHMSLQSSWSIKCKKVSSNYLKILDRSRYIEEIWFFFKIGSTSLSHSGLHFYYLSNVNHNCPLPSEYLMVKM